MIIYIVVPLLILLSALFSGLTLGLMGLNLYDVKRKMQDGNKYAAKVYPLRVQGNLLLTSLLLGNVFVNTILSIFLGSVTSGIMASIIATALIFVFGEIIPQAVISRYALPFGAFTAPLIRMLVFILYPIVYPIAWLLDKVLGREMPTLYTHNELISIIAEHEDAAESTLDHDEERIMHGALKFSQKSVGEVMTPKSVVVGVVHNEKFTHSLIDRLLDSGLSRFPVYGDNTKEEIIGLLYIRSLVGIEVSGHVYNLKLRKAHIVDKNMPLDDALNKFISTRMHMFIVHDEFDSFAGVITMEDVLEEVLQREIIDEEDRHIDMGKIDTTKKLDGVPDYPSLSGDA